MSDIDHFISGSEKLREAAGGINKPCVAILGSFNSGKSTLLNCLLGEEISPVGIVPTTSCLLYFDYGSSFKAKFSRHREKRTFHQITHLHSFLGQMTSAGGRVDVEMPSPILKKCSLMDTPGINSLDNDSFCAALQAAAMADKLIYLFHQRGLEDQNRLFLYKLASVWKNRDINDLSFWLNCNLGLSDGTSLETTRTALRDIFLSQIRLNTINTSGKENMERLRLFLEVEFARAALRQAHTGLKKSDGALPQRIKKVAGIKEDSHFLSEFWRVQETARELLEAGKLLHSLPSVLKELDCIFSEMNSANLGAEIKKPGGRPYCPRVVELSEIKKVLLNLIQGLLTQKEVAAFMDRAELKNQVRRIEEERFTVVAAGGFSTGKSTFFNALLKEELLPTADGPTTSSVTRIVYGPRKKATLHLPLQVTLHICANVEGKACLNREELAALESWLGDSGSDVAYFEACVDGRFKRVARRELAAMVIQVKERFAAGAFARAEGSPVLPAAFRLLPLKILKGNRVLEKARVTFKNPGTREFDLSEPEGMKEFREAVGPDNAFRIEFVDIQHPSEFLKLADFIDTPGLDWIQKHHHERTSAWIRQSDAYLIFLNARHILNHMDRENFQELFSPGAAGDSGGEDFPANGDGRFFFVINFSDVLTPSQRETVFNFARKNLSGLYQQSKPIVFLISSLRALAGEDAGMASLLKDLEKGIMKCRGRSFYLSRLDELYSTLEKASKKINDQFPDGKNAYEKKRDLRRGQEVLRDYRRKLKEIKNLYLNPGRL